MPSAAEAASLGLTVEEATLAPVQCYPCNMAAATLFASLCTQWRMGSNGPVGLDYNVLYHKLDRMKLEPEEYERIEQAIYVMEDAALVHLYKD